MSTKTKVHPLYSAMQDAWRTCRDCLAGQSAIKKQRDRYLPPTSGMVLDGFGEPSKIGEKAYQAYLMRAFFPEIFEDAVETAIGIMHRKPAVIQLPPRMEKLMTRATDDGEDLQMLLRRINSEQLISGRLGILGDLRTVAGGAAEPIVVIYRDLAIYNWDDRHRDDNESGLRFVALDESGNELQDDMSWKWVNRSRILGLIDPSTEMLATYNEDGSLPANVIYGYVELEETEEFSGEKFTPVNSQGTTIGSIPFCFINSIDMSSTPDKPPLQSVANLSLAIYRAEADYRQNLFMQGQDTLVRIGMVTDESEPVRTGAGACIDVPINGDAKYIGVSGSGLTEQRESLKLDYERAEAKTAKLLAKSSSAESGEALAIRMASQTATLPQIAKTGAAALQTVLRQLAELLNENPEDVIVEPNLEFADKAADANSLLTLVQSKLQGAPISDQSIHAYMVQNDFTTMTYEEELALISGEEPRL